MKKKEIIRLEKILVNVGFNQHGNAFTVDLGLDKKRNSYSLYWHRYDTGRFYVYKISAFHPCCDIEEVKKLYDLPKDVFKKYNEIMMKFDEAGVVFEISEESGTVFGIKGLRE